MGAVEELQPAKLDEGDVAPGELDLEFGRMRGGAEQHGLLLQRRAALAAGEDAFDHVAGLTGLVLNRHQPRLFRRYAFGPQVLGETLLALGDHRVGGFEDRLGGAVVAVERHNPGLRGEGAGKIKDVAHRRGAEGIDRLRVVADHRQPVSIRLQRQKDRGLQPIGILVLVDQHVIETAAQVLGDGRLAHHGGPVEQQVVVIEHLLALL